ncbi:MAG: PfkB family carbohydrate kinase [Bacteroidales bacterium]
MQKLSSKQINTEGLQIKQDEKTFFWSGKYHEDMNSRETLVTELNSLERFDPIVPSSYQSCNYLMLGNLSPIVQRQVIERMNKRPSLIVMDTMNFWMQIMLPELLKTISMVDVLTINDEEARLLTGASSLACAAEKVLTMGPKYVIIKKGEHGAMIWGKEGVFVAPAIPLKEVFDPTGAGDTFAGGFIGYLSKSERINFEEMKKALLMGTVMASFCVEKFGTERIENLKFTDINERLIALKRMISVDVNSIEII